MTAALQDLLARVEVAMGSDRELDFDLERLALEGDGWEREDCGVRHSPKWIRAEGDGRYFVHGVAPPLTGSVDSALALVERVLPGWVWEIQKTAFADGRFHCWMSADWTAIGEIRCYGFTAPLAILSACLRVLIAKGGAA